MLSRIVDSSPFWKEVSFPWQYLGRIRSGDVYANSLSGMRIICSLDRLDDGKTWLHVSCSHSDRLPTWEELHAVKLVFIGREVEAIQVLPKESEYVNCMPYCLHIWAEWPTEKENAR